jgi:SAM-dependent methyltransferase
MIDENPLARYRATVLEAWAVRTGIESGIFERLVEPRTADALAASTRLDRTALGALLDALVATEQLVRDGDSYSVASDARPFVLRGSPRYIGGSLGFLTTSHHFARYPDILGRGGAVEPTSAEWERMTRGSAAYVPAAIAALFARAPELASGPRRVLDVGCGQGDFLNALVERNPEIAALGIDPTPSVAEVARARTEGRGIAIEAKHLADVSDEFDTVFLNHVLHIVGEAPGALLLSQAFARTAPGGRVYVQELVLDDAPEVALFGLTMRLHFERGRVFRTSEIARLLSSVGFADAGVVPIPAPTRGLVFVTARKV